MSFLEDNNANNTFTSQKLKHFNNYYNTQLNNDRLGEDSSFTQAKNTFQMNNVVSTNVNQYEMTLKPSNTKNEKGEIEPLVTKEELRIIDRMHAIVLMTRMMPLKTEMIPNWKINWGYESVPSEIPEKQYKNTVMSMVFSY